ncbi:heme biosynthesis HemY N-terminal domain-containing protein [Alteromonas oceanisediminis]|uniref:heme biosynthesis HemY N-terminal domain-containing protein n=1 Tax=Alteromonas oceanisediminis TaxID=2836180 RepID=UPI001BDB65E8|nr:heme biosynthesis HemY N-terminal domain-containing protein [Alteromonas oceanisediminis]MBT0586794.1 heme biosynthesis protein HemY [Alteromonas oceanisediminis]
MSRLVMVILLLIAIVVAMIVGPSLVGEKGYVLIAMGNTTIETSVIAALFMVLAAIVVFLVLEWLVKRLYRVLGGSKTWLGSLSSRRVNRAYFKGITAYFEGDLVRADKWLSRTHDGDFDGVNLLAAGQVAAEQGQTERAHKLWQRAADDSRADYAAKVCIVKQFVKDEQPHQALDVIESLSEKEQQRRSIVNLWILALAQAGRWQDIQQKLPKWRGPLGEDYHLWARQAAQGEFAEIASKSGANQLMQHWHQLPRSVRRDPAKQAAYVQQLLDQGMHQDAQKHLVEWQSSGQVPQLLPLFKQLRLPNPSPSVKLIEHWLKSDENNVELLTTLGHIACNCGNDILAEKALQKAVKLEPSQERLRLLANISERKQDNVKALALYKQSVE